jgi:hypothetical protein
MRVSGTDLMRVENRICVTSVVTIDLVRLDQHIAVGQQLMQLGETLISVEIQRDALLAGVAHGEEQAHTLVQRCEASRCGSRGWLDFDDLCSEVGEQASAQLTTVNSEVDDAYA